MTATRARLLRLGAVLAAAALVAGGLTLVARHRHWDCSDSSWSIADGAQGAPTREAALQTWLASPDGEGAPRPSSWVIGDSTNQATHDGRTLQLTHTASGWFVTAQTCG